MSRQDSETIRRRRDGSIDSDHYIARGMRARSLEAHRALDFLLALVGRIVADTEGREGGPRTNGTACQRSRDRLSAGPAVCAASAPR